jgi:hypothetical protein
MATGFYDQWACWRFWTQVARYLSYKWARQSATRF